MLINVIHGQDASTKAGDIVLHSTPIKWRTDGGEEQNVASARAAEHPFDARLVARVAAVISVTIWPEASLEVCPPGLHHTLSVLEPRLILHTRCGARQPAFSER